MADTLLKIVVCDDKSTADNVKLTLSAPDSSYKTVTSAQYTRATFELGAPDGTKSRLGKWIVIAQTT